MKNFTMTKRFPVAAATLYQAWLDSREHSSMTGGEAVCSPEEGVSFTAWDGYISGKTIKLVPECEIVQSWRTAEFKEEDPDSEVTIRLTPVEGGTELTLIHQNIPEGQPDYEEGWKDHYFTPMEAYFG